jgi:hypothetical protein
MVVFHVCCAHSDRSLAEPVGPGVRVNQPVEAPALFVPDVLREGTPGHAGMRRRRGGKLVGGKRRLPHWTQSRPAGSTQLMIELAAKEYGLPPEVCVAAPGSRARIYRTPRVR